MVLSDAFKQFRPYLLYKAQLCKVGTVYSEPHPSGLYLLQLEKVANPGGLCLVGRSLGKDGRITITNLAEGDRVGITALAQSRRV